MSCLCEFEAECNGLGMLHCRGCGGDLCVCMCGGEAECPGCEWCSEQLARTLSLVAKDRRHAMEKRRPDVALAHAIGERLPPPLYSVDDGPGQIATIERHGPAPERIECGCLLFVSFHGKRYVLAIAEYSETGEND